MESRLKLYRCSFVTAVLVCLSFSAIVPVSAYARSSVETWGRTTDGECNVPPPNSDFKAITAGYNYSLGLKNDGSIVGWGRNDYNQRTVPLPNSDFKAVVAGTYHSLGLKNDGSIVGWGYNYYGQCNVPAPNSDFKAIAVGAHHSIGLKNDGSIVAWGFNDYSQCNVPDPNTNFKAIAAGSYHSLGLKNDGSIVAWGSSNLGEIDVPSPNSNFKAIAAGASFSLGLKNDGSVAGWGNNYNGQRTVPSPNADFKAIAAGEEFSLGLKNDGSIVTWGYNDYGQRDVPSPNAGFAAISAGSFHSLGLKAAYGGGVGTVNDPYRIADVNDLLALAADANDYSKAFVLVNDIDLSGVAMIPIGNNTLQYTGIFDGNNHVIRNMTINRPGGYWIGLFGYLGPGGEAKNLGIVDANLHGAGDMGCIAGYSEGSITSCYATGIVAGTEFAVGGLVGYMWLDTTLTSSYATVDVNSGGNYVGGLAGISYGKITDCYATGSVSGSNLVGGLVGANGHTFDAYIPRHYYGEIISCYSTGAVSGTGSYVGSLVGLNESDDGKITNCFWNTQTSGLAEGVGSGISTGIYGKTTAEMQTQSTFTDVGWDFAGETVNGPNDIWKMPFDGGYPMLSWQDIVTIGQGTESWYLPLYTFYEDSRTQTIYLASEIGGAKTLRSLALDITTLPIKPLNNFAIRLKHTNLAAYATNLWESTGWTTVYQSIETISTPGWTTFTFTTPFEYDGIDNLMVDISYSDNEWGTYAECRYSVPGGIRSISYSYDNTTNPLTWSGSSPTPVSSSNVPNIRLGFTSIPTVNVPDVVGLTQTDANAAIITAGLVVGTITTDYNDSVAAGDIISQSPAAGTTVEPNTAVDIVISLGTEEVDVPNVVGMTQSDADSAIIAAGLIVGTVTTAYNDSVAAGDVISQSPTAGTGVDPNTAVDLVVSLGRWLDLQVTKCSVTAGSKYLAITDKISFSGIMNATNGEMLAASQIVVTVDSADMAIPCIMTFPRNDTTYKKGSYNYTIKGATWRSSFKFSTKTGKFSFSAKNIDLSGLGCPVTVRIQIGGSSGIVDVNETVVNGTKKLVPYQLMMDVQNSLMADRVKVRRSSKLDSDSLTISGRFTAASDPHLSNPLVITVGSQTFTVPGNLFIDTLIKNGTVSCRNAASIEYPLALVTAKLNYAKCTFSISIKNASITPPGNVDFGINCFGESLDDPSGIDLLQ